MIDPGDDPALEAALQSLSLVTRPPNQAFTQRVLAALPTDQPSNDSRSHSMKIFRNKAVLAIAVIIVLGGVGAILAATLSAPRGAAASVQTLAVQRGDLSATVLSSGALQPAADLNLTFSAAGTVAQLFVHKGQPVHQGDKLAALDPQDLQLAVDQAAANLASAQAKLDAVKAGALPKDVADAQATLRAAQAKLADLKAGPLPADLATAQAPLTSPQSKLHPPRAGPPPQDVASDQAAIAAAQAKLAALKAGPTPQDVASDQAAITAAQAKLAALQAGSTPQDLANAQSAVTAAQAKLTARQAGTTPQDLATAQSQVVAAQAKLAQLQAGPTAAQLSAAQVKVTSAQDNLTKVSSSASLAKQQAEIALNQAANAVRDAQDTLAQVTTSRGLFNPDGTLNTNAPTALLDKYYADLRAEQDAEGNMTKAQLALADAQQQEIQDVAAAQATLADAQKQLADVQAGALPADLVAAQATLDQARNNLSKLQAGTTPADLAAAQSTLDQARNNLSKLQAGTTPADLAAAQTALDQARNNLAKLQAGPTSTDLTQAQAGVDQATNALAKLRAGATADDLTQAQAAVDQAAANLSKVRAGATAADLAAAQTAVDQAQNNLSDLTAWAKSTDVTSAQAAVDQARASLESAQLKLSQATLTAPFSGVVADLPISVGQQVSGATTAVDLLDASAYHVDMNVGESDISRIAVGQDVNLTFDALPGEVFTGTITYVAPKATIASGVVSYLATATLDPKAAGSVIKPGMTTTAAAVVDQRTAVLMVPNRAIKTEGRQKVVYVLSGQAQVRVPITTGISNDQFTEVTGDTPLRDGDAVVTSPTTAASTAPTGGGIFNLGGAARGGR